MKKLKICKCCKGFFAEFKEFALKGNVFDLAIGIIIGTAFTQVVHSLVEDVITPPFGLLLGGVDFVDLTIKMPNFVYTDRPTVVIRYGKFLQEIISLFIMALVLFLIIKGVKKLQEVATKRRLEEGANLKKELTEEVKVLHEIRDILAKKTAIVNECRL